MLDFLKRHAKKLAGLLASVGGLTVLALSGPVALGAGALAVGAFLLGHDVASPKDLVQDVIDIVEDKPDGSPKN